MRISEELAKALDSGVFDSLNRFLGMASSCGVRSIVLDCQTRKVSVDLYQPTDTEDGDSAPESCYQNWMKASKTEDRAKGILGMWKRKQFVTPTEVLYQKLVGKQLEVLLRSDFLVPDDWSPSEDMAGYIEELGQWDLTDRNYYLRYCLLRQMLNLEHGRLIVNEAVTGRYLEARSEKLTQESVKCFFCFVQLCQLVYAEMDKLEGMKDELSAVDQSLLARLLEYTDRGDWQSPATSDKIKSFFKELFSNKEARDFFKGGKAGSNTDRVEVSMANVLGYLMNYQLLAGGQKQISIDFFGNEGQVNNINKGKKLEGNQQFKDLLPMMDKYRTKIIL